MVAFEEELDDDEDAARERVAMRGVRGDSEGSDDGEEVVVCSRISFRHVGLWMADTCGIGRA